MTTKTMTRKLVSIMSADVKEYSRLMREDEISTIRTLTAYRKIMESFIRHHHGRVVDAAGDNILAEFPSVIDSMQCAVGIQKELKKRNTGLPDHRKMEFRMGVTLGDVIVKGERIYGHEVNMASSLEALAEPGGICISQSIFDQIDTKLPFEYKYVGKKHVKNNGAPVPVFKVYLNPGERRQRSEQKTNDNPWDLEKYGLNDLMENMMKQSDHFLKKLSRHMQAFQGMRETGISRN
jgi:class 3 adenylate cyclase